MSVVVCLDMCVMCLCVGYVDMCMQFVCVGYVDMCMSWLCVLGMWISVGNVFVC